MGWYDGSLGATISRPIIAVSFTTGVTIVYDLDENVIIGRLKHYDKKITAIKWSAFDPSLFFLGADTGLLCICQLINSKSVSIKMKVNLSFPIDFIALDSLDGLCVLCASQKGDLYIINDYCNLDSSSTVQENDVKHILTAKDNDDVIKTIDFFPNQYEFILFSTGTGSFVYIANDDFNFPYIMTPEIISLFPSTVSNNYIVVTAGGIDLWAFEDNKSLSENDENSIFQTSFSHKNLVRVSNLFISKSNIAEVNTVSYLNGKICIFTYSNWINIIEERKDKLFLSQRVRLMPDKPIDWDFFTDSIAFLTSSNDIVITDTIPNPGVTDSPSRGVNQLSNVLSERGKVHSLSLSPRKRSASLMIDDFQGNQPQPLHRQSSSTIKINSNLSSNADMEDSNTNSRRSLIPNKKTSSMGSSNTIIISFHINSKRLQHIKWITRHKILVWGNVLNKNSLYIIDLKKRKILQLMKKQLETIKIPVSDVQLSPDRKLAFISFSGKLITFIHTRKNFETISTINIDIPAVGDFSPNIDLEDGSYRAVFVYEGPTIMVLKINPLDKAASIETIFQKTLKAIRVTPTFVQWKNTFNDSYSPVINEIILGSKEGKLLIIDPDAGYSMKQIETINGSVKSAHYVNCDGIEYFIENDIGKCYIIKKKKLRELRGQIKNYKFASSTTLLVSYNKSKSLSVLSISKESKIEYLPPVAFISQPDFYKEAKKQKSIPKLIDVCIKHSQVFIAKALQIIIKSPEDSYNLDWLLWLSSEANSFSSKLFRLALFASDFDLAHHLLMKTDPNSPDYIINMTKASFFDIPLLFSQIRKLKPRFSAETIHDTKVTFVNDEQNNELFGQKMEISIQSFIGSGHIDNAIETLLMIGQVERAVKLLIGNSDFKQAALIILTQNPQQRNIEIVKKLAEKLFENNHYYLALQILSQSRLIDDAVQLVCKKYDFFQTVYERINSWNALTNY